MKRTYVLFGILLILIGSILSGPVLGDNSQEELSIDLKVLIVVLGTANLCFEENEIYGFATFGYTNGESFMFERYTINFEGIPFFIHKGIGFTFCIYNSSDE